MAVLYSAATPMMATATTSTAASSSTNVTPRSRAGHVDRVKPKLDYLSLVAAMATGEIVAGCSKAQAIDVQNVCERGNFAAVFARFKDEIQMMPRNDAQE